MGLYKRKGSQNWYARVGRHVDVSTGTADKDRARLVLQEIEGGRDKASGTLTLQKAGDAKSKLLTKYTREVLRKCKARHPYELTELGERKLLAQAAGGRCSITGMPFSLFKPEGAHRRPYAPSVDRIDASKPYTDGNTRLVCVCVNYALNEWGEKVLRQMALGYLQSRFIPWAAEFNQGD